MEAEFTARSAKFRRGRKGLGFRLQRPPTGNPLGTLVGVSLS